MRYLSATPRRWAGRAALLALLPGLAALTCWLSPQLPRATIAAGENARLEVLSQTGDLLMTSQPVIEHRRLGSGPVPRTGRLCAWDTRTGQLRFAWSDVGYVQFSADRRLFAATDKDRHLRVWDLSTGAARADVELETESDGLFGSHFSADGRYLVLERRPCAPDDPPVMRFWDIGAKRSAGSIPGTYYQMAFGRDAKNFATFGGRNEGRGTELTVWRLDASEDMPTKVLERTFGFRGGAILAPGLEFAAVIAPHEKEDDTRHITVWDVASGRAIGTGHHADAKRLSLQTLWFSDDARFLFARSCGPGPSGWAWQLTAWAVADGLPELCSLADEFGAKVSPDGKWVAQVTSNGVQVLDTAGRLRGVLHRRGDSYRVFNGHFAGDMKTSVVSATFSPDSRYLLVRGLSHEDTGPLASAWLPTWARRASGQLPWTARLWRLDDTGEVAAFTSCQHAVFSQDGTTLATLHADHVIRVWDVPPRKPVVAALVVATVAWLAILLSARLGRAWLARRRWATDLPRQTTADGS